MTSRLEVLDILFATTCRTLTSYDIPINVKFASIQSMKNKCEEFFVQSGKWASVKNTNDIE